MNKEQVKKIRKFYGTDDLFVVCGDSRIVDGSRAASTLIWDDENELLYSFKKGEEYHLANHIDSTVIDYDNIEQISNLVNIKGAEELLSKLENEGLLKNNNRNNIINEFKSIFNYNIGRFTNKNI